MGRGTLIEAGGGGMGEGRTGKGVNI